jgi:hypothetical protein
MQTVTCPNPRCGVQLLISSERSLKCGRCGEPLSVQIKKTTGFFARLRNNLFRKKSSHASASTTGYTKLQAKVDLLAKRTWGSREDIKSTRLELAPKAIERHIDHGQIVGALLKHVRLIAPNISVPVMTPRVVVEPMCGAAGQFIEQDGWVKIAVNPSFWNNIAAARSILCHELCHYILNANGIRQSPDSENERLTDAAIFVFGLGTVFLAGYQKSASEYRVGHRLGYLTDDEYEFLKHYIPHLRGSELFLKTAKRQDDWRWDRSLR